MSLLWIVLDTLGTHGLSCYFRAGHNAMLNDILHRALSSTNIPSRLESTGLDCTDGKHPDGMTMVPGHMADVLFGI